MQNQTSDIIIFCLLITLFILILLVFILGILYAYQKRQIAYELNFNKLQNEHENHLLASQLEMQEKTFQHISNEIHDNISLNLTLAKLHLTNELENSAVKTNLFNVSELIGTALADLRNLSRGLNSSYIANNGFIKALENELKMVEQTGKFTVELKIEGDPIFANTSKELILFRIFQEFIHNIIKHSGGKRILIRLSFKGKSLDFYIEDDGIGFDPQKSKMGSLGLVNIEKRIHSLSGEYSIKSDIGLGTQIKIFIPDIE